MENKELNENILQNIQAIKNYNSKLANEILMFNAEKSNINLAQNENGEYNLILNSIPIHSTNSAINEANTIANNLVDNSNSFFIVYGFGLGYLPDAISNKIKQGKIIIYEPNIDILKFVLSIAKIDALHQKNVIIFSDKQTLKDYIYDTCDENSNLSISFLNSYKDLFFEDIKNTLKVAQSAQMEFIGNKNTFSKKAMSCFMRTIYNLRHICKNPDITDFKDVYKNKTALILCAGPSLKANLDLIKQNQDKFVIFALNPILNMLEKNNINYDFIVAIENNHIEQQFRNVKYEEKYLISEAFIFHEILDDYKFKNAISYISDNNFFNYWVRDCFQIKNELKSFGTVSYNALMSAKIMGFNKIILLGQNLAYENGECYCKGSMFENLKCVYNEESKKYEIIALNFERYSRKLLPGKPQEELNEIAKNYLKTLNKNLCTVKSQEGKDIPSKIDYLVFIKLFEQTAIDILKENPNIELINSSTNGAQIDGFKNIPLEKIVKNLEPIEKIDLSNYTRTFDKNYVLKKIENLKSQIEIFYELTEKFISTTEKLLNKLNEDNTFDDEAITLAKTHNEILAKIVALKDIKDVDFIVNVYLYKYADYFKINYFKDIETAKNTLPNIIIDYKTISKNLYDAIHTLSDSHSLILE